MKLGRVGLLSLFAVSVVNSFLGVAYAVPGAKNLVVDEISFQRNSKDVPLSEAIGLPGVETRKLLFKRKTQVSEVARKFELAIESQSRFVRLNFAESQLQDKDLITIFHSIPAGASEGVTIHLDLSNNRDLSSRSLIYLAAMKGLELINLKGSSLKLALSAQPETISDIISKTELVQLIRELDLENLNPTPEELEMVRDFLPYLEKLHLWYNNQLSQPHFEILSTFGYSIRTLNLRFTQMSYENLLAILSQNKSITEFEIEHTPAEKTIRKMMKDRSWSIEDLKVEFPQLQRLSPLDRDEVQESDDEDAEALAEFAKQFGASLVQKPASGRKSPPAVD